MNPLDILNGTLGALSAFAIGNFVTVLVGAAIIVPIIVGVWLFWEYQIHVNHITNPVLARRSPTIEAYKKMTAAYRRARTTGWLSPQKNRLVGKLSRHRKRVRQKYTYARLPFLGEDPPKE